MTDHAKAVEMLREIRHLSTIRCQQHLEVVELCDWRFVDRRLEAALSALSDERGEEEWRAMPDLVEGWRIQGEYSCRIVARGMSEHDAKRIASDHNRLGRLERAAREVVELWHSDVTFGLGKKINALSAALTEEAGDG